MNGKKYQELIYSSGAAQSTEDSGGSEHTKSGNDILREERTILLPVISIIP